MAHGQEVMSSNLGTIYWMDISDATYNVINKMEIKVAKWGTLKNILKNNFLLTSIIKDNTYSLHLIKFTDKVNYIYILHIK